MNTNKDNQTPQSVLPYRGFPVDLLSWHESDWSGTISLRTVLEAADFTLSSAAIPIACGHEADGRPNVQDLCQFPHLLICGDEGSGKTSFLHAMLFSIFINNGPEYIKLFLVDTKREFEEYNGIPHLAVPIISNAECSVAALDWLLREMLRRFAEMDEVKATDFESYHNALAKLGRKKHPRIVFIVDEIIDLMQIDPQNTENLICRIAQLGRWAGIHLILSTQNTIGEVFTKLITDNFHSRVVFHMAAPRAAKNVLECEEAVNLQRQGEMILSRRIIESNFKIKVPYVTACEISSVTTYLRKQYGTDYDVKVIRWIRERALSLFRQKMK